MKGTKMKLLNNEKGLSIIEVMVAIAIFSIGFSGIAGLQLSSSFKNRNASDTASAYVSATDWVEGVVSLPFTDALLVDGAGANNGAAGLNDGLSPYNPANADGSSTTDNYTIFWNIEDNDISIPADGQADLKTIRFFVSWNSVQGQKVVTLNYIKPNL